MMTNLMKDLADIGSSIGSEFKVCYRDFLTYQSTYNFDSMILGA